MKKRLASLEPNASNKKKKTRVEEKEKQKMFERNFAGLSGREAHWHVRS